MIINGQFKRELMMTDKVQELVRIINQVRLDNKDKWYFFNNYENGIRLKGYNTWIQIIYLYKTGSNYANGAHYLVDSSGMDISVTEFKEYLTKIITKHLQNREDNNA